MNGLLLCVGGHASQCRRHCFLPLFLFAQRGEQERRRKAAGGANTWLGPAGWLVRSANLKCAGAGNPRAVRRFPFAFTQRVRFTDGYRRGRIFHFSTAGGLRNGYDSLSHPAVTALPAVRGSLRSCVLRTCFAGRYRMGLIGQTSAGDFADVWMRPHSGSLLARRRRPAGLPSGQLSQGRIFHLSAADA